LHRIGLPHDGERSAIGGGAATFREDQRIEELVNRAATLVDQRGRAAFDEFRKRDSQWSYVKGFRAPDGMTGLIGAGFFDK
jgi:hypothetical protein